MPIHGTTSEHLASILFEILDPGLPQKGLFGKRIYFAEDAANIDQYVDGRQALLTKFYGIGDEDCAGGGLFEEIVRRFGKVLEELGDLA